MKLGNGILTLVWLISLSLPAHTAPSDALKRWDNASPPRVNRFPQFDGTQAGAPWSGDMQMLASYRANGRTVGATDTSSFELSSRRTVQTGERTAFLANDGYIKYGYFQRQNGKFTEMRNGQIRDHFVRNSQDSKRLAHVRNHIGRDEQSLIREAGKRNSSDRGFSSFRNEAQASKFTSEAIVRNQDAINHWKRNARPGEIKHFDAHFPNQTTGLHVAKNANQVREVKRVSVVLRADPNSNDGYMLHSTYPSP